MPDQPLISLKDVVLSSGFVLAAVTSLPVVAGSGLLKSLSALVGGT